jgi:hypothetical protein
MLLQYRLDHYFAPLPEPIRLNISGRLLQLYWPLAREATPKQLPDLDALILRMREDLDDEAERGPEAAIARAIQQLASKPGNEPIPFDKICARA